ncbi:hypothetical protein G7077_01335 [Sphingomonas piscis]|uniref:Lipoprotein n=1 Tax=Sphingomonas piscis TaxID=2714943 RepID=A0A6G7YM17_9SPHN|nr:hypothetical protein [Sphingomonas piscis]QIK77756.1 hypothetical protein G7077_01335 [Sphingomonas piscis]
MKRSLVLAALVAALAVGGCASRMDRQLRGQPVAAAVAAFHGDVPDNVVDLPGGIRLFEWVTTDVIVQEDNGYDRNERWWTTERRMLDGGVPSRNCVLQVFAQWDEARGTWVVHSYRNRSTEGCGMRR